uniref:porin n=1 Tax=Tabrizicola sp. TaxID=2005166 RepID=UPI00286B43FE
SGFAAAEITLSGDARMGIIDDFGTGDTAFTSRARVKFTMSGETDGGLSFGASFRADNAVDAKGGTAGEVFISGAFGKLAMGDVDGAAQAAVGNVSGVGLTGLSDTNELAFLLGGEDPSALYSYSSGALGLFLSVQANGGNSNYGVGANYTTGAYKFGIGYESLEDGSTPGGGWPDKINFSSFFGNGATQVVLGADATFGAVTAKVRFARYSEDSGTDLGMDQTALSIDYAMDALTLTAFVSNYRGTDGYAGDDGDFYGLGAAYDLGGGAKVVGGYVKADSSALGDTSAFDLGVSFSF